MPAPDADRFLRDVLRNPCNRQLMDRLPAVGLPDAWLVAGCLFQTVWNVARGQPPGHGIADYDVFYFDADDLGAGAEAERQRQVDAACAGLGIAVDVKNQARVHLWYPGRFGQPCAPMASAREGIDRFLVRCTRVGLRLWAAPQPYLPDSLDDLYDGVLRPNPLCDHPALFAAKVASYQARWAGLRTAP